MSKSSIFSIALIVIICMTGSYMYFFGSKKELPSFNNFRQMAVLQSNDAPLMTEITIEVARYLKKCCNIMVYYESLDGNRQNDPILAQRILRNNPPMVMGVGTSGSLALLKEIEKSGKKTVLIFSGVTDPYHSRIVDKWEGGREKLSTGGSDKLNPSYLLFFALQILPQAKRVGYIHNPLEDNSVVELNETLQAARETNTDIVTATALNVGEVGAATMSLINNKVDAILITGSNVSLSGVDEIYNLTKGKIPLIGNDINLYKHCVASIGPDRIDLSKKTGEIIEQIVKNKKDPRDIAVVRSYQLQRMLNLKLAAEYGIKIEKEILNGVDKIIE